MLMANSGVGRIKVSLLSGMLLASTGCAGFTGAGYYDDQVVVQGPDMYLFGGDYERGRGVHEYARRGSGSRGAAHHADTHVTSADRGKPHPNERKVGKR